MMDKKTETNEIKDELKTRSFRITDETANKIKSLADQIGGNQQQTLATLIETYELQAAKNLYGEDKRAQIEKFENYTTVITRMFMDSIEDSENALDIAKSQTDALLRSKDETISNLQDKIREINKSLEEAVAESKPLKEKVAKIETDLNDYQKKYKDKEDAFNILAKRCEELEKQENETRALYDQNVKNIVQLQNELSKYKDKELTYRDNIGKLTSERNSLSKENEQLISKAESLTADIESLKSTAAAEKELIIKMTKLEVKDKIHTEAQEQLNKFMAESDERIKKYKEEADKYREMYYQIMEKEKRGTNEQ